LQKTNNMMNSNKLKSDFPILSRQIHGFPLAYLDNAATTQKPIQVLQALEDYYKQHNANIHRGVHVLSEEATQMYEQARQTVADFIGAKFEEIIFTRNTTEGLNLIAYSWGLANLKKDDEIILSIAEHHSNIVPWQIVAAKTGAVIKYIGIDELGNLILQGSEDSLERLLNEKTKILSLVHISNVIGIINPVEQFFGKAKKYNPDILCVLDGAQSAPHVNLDVVKLKADFIAFSGHKMLGPMGIGVLWGRKEILENMEPFLGGGDMIGEVYQDRFTTNELPYKFEAGTPNVEGAIGLAAAINYIRQIGWDNIVEHEKNLTSYCLEKLSKLNEVRIIGPKKMSAAKAGLISFYHEQIHAHDLAQVLDSVGVAVRSGHHCAMPLHEYLKISASCRTSFYFYNTKEEIDRMIEGIKKAEKIFRV